MARKKKTTTVTPSLFDDPHGSGLRHYPADTHLLAWLEAKDIAFHIITDEDLGIFERIKALEPSASTLVLMVHFLVSRIVGGCKVADSDQAVLNRLILRSLADDGEFARAINPRQFRRREADPHRRAYR